MIRFHPKAHRGVGPWIDLVWASEPDTSPRASILSPAGLVEPVPGRAATRRRQ